MVRYVVANTGKEMLVLVDFQDDYYCYELKPLELGKRTNSCIRVNTRELDKEPFTK